MKKVIYILLGIITTVHISAQVITPSLTEGCLPLEVSFSTTSTPANYFWDFGDGTAGSDQSNPSYIFTIPGNYTIKLFDGQGGNELGETTVQVYPRIDVDFTLDNTGGCAPINITFTDNSVVDPNIVIESYEWTFGDGFSRSGGSEESHLFQNPGIWTPGLEISSSTPNCTEDLSKEDLITISEGLPVQFIVQGGAVQCTAPATFTFQNLSNDDPAYTFTWDFGNGESFTGKDPDPVTYTQEGEYVVVLSLDNGEGCVVNDVKTVKIGGPEIDIEVNDTICVNQNTFLVNNTDATMFEWTFGSDTPPSTLKEPLVRFFTPGQRFFTLSATDISGCTADTIFPVFVQEVDPTFAVDPAITCSDPAIFTFTANQADLATYRWNGVPSSNNTHIEEYEDKSWDSFHINRPDTIFMNLIATSHAGCVAAYDSFAIFRDIEAHTIPNVSRGCAPLTVDFEQLSISVEPFTRFDWNFGDGTMLSDPTGSNQTHTYTDPGEYYVKLIVENENGCIDTSTGVWIYVGEPLSSDFTVTPREICLFDTVSLTATNLDPRIDAWHFDTDDGRNGHCYINPETNHTFVTSAGSYPVTLEIEYNGCYNKLDAGTIDVSGPKALIQYMTNCDDPYTVMFRDSSFFASNTTWTIEGNTFETGDLQDSILNYTFSDTGVYIVYLEAFDNTSMCPSNIDSVEIHIVDVFASFAIPPKLCSEQGYYFDASASIGADTRCHKGYTWYFPNSRPRRIDSTAILQGLISPPGDLNNNFVDIRLEVEDINGCVDDTTISVQVYDVSADFTLDRSAVCFNSRATMTAAYIADTTIVSYQWSNTSANDSIVNIITDESGEVNGFYQVSLVVTDVLGCTAAVQRSIPIYEIASLPTLDPAFACIGDSVMLSATDFTSQGSFLHFDWEIPTAGISSDEQSFKVAFDTPGTYPVLYQFEEDSSGCKAIAPPFNITVEDYPEARFELDSEPPYCTSSDVFFKNTSPTGEGANYSWTFEEGGSMSNIPFDEPVSQRYPNRGIKEVTLIASTPLAECRDTFSLELEVIEPSADIIISDNDICFGEEITIQLVNIQDVLSYTWSLGDGTNIENIDSFTYVYDFDPSLGANEGFRRIINLQLMGSDTACTFNLNETIDFANISAFFELDSLPCFQGAQIKEAENNDMSWDITYTDDLGNVLDPADIIPIQNTPGKQEVIVTMKVSEPICGEISYSDTLAIDIKHNFAVPNFFSPNNDTANDSFNIVVQLENSNFQEEERATILGCYDVNSQIFNRWGQKVFQSESGDMEGWDGSFNGKMAEPDTYVYIITITPKEGNGEPIIYKGNVILSY